MKNPARAHLSFTFYVILASLGMLCLYAASAPHMRTVLSRVYLISVAGYFAGVLFVANLALYPTRMSSYSRWIAPAVAWAWLNYLVIDYATFNLYGFHVNLLLVEMFVTNPSGVGVPAFLLVVFGLLAVVLGIGVYCVDRLSQRTPDKLHSVSSILLMLIVPAIAANSVIHIWANRYDREEITSIDPLFPVYYPATSYRNAPRISAVLPSIFPSKSGERLNLAVNDDGIVRYPLKPLSFEKQDSAPSILFVVLESWQTDSLRPDIMPHLCEFTKTATRFDQHLSGGSTTAPGLFSLLFGLHPSYYEKFKGTAKSCPSQLTESFHKLGYHSRVFTSSHLDRFSLRSLFFSRVTEEDYHAGGDDQWAVDEYLTDLDSDNSRDSPRFDFVFLTSSHSPYQYPEQYSRFAPLPLLEGGFALNKSADATPYKNDYHNSLYYSDALLKQIFDKLQAVGRAENTWIIVTGDHAEEFNENGMGYWGHGSNFTRWQTQIPLVVKSPGQTEGATETRLSLHQDIVPTVMQAALGCRNPTSDYANGANLFQLPENRGTVLASYFHKAYLIDGVVIEGLTGKKYAWDDMKQSRSLNNVERIRVVMNQERHFLR